MVLWGSLAIIMHEMTGVGGVWVYLIIIIIIIIVGVYVKCILS